MRLTEAMTHVVNEFLAAQAAAGAELHSLTIIRAGERLVELAAAPWSLDHPALVYSMSKTFTSAAFGIAWADGLLSPDDLVVDVVPEVGDDKVGPKARSIRLADCLAMASGHTFDTISLLTGRWEVTPSALGLFLHDEPEGTPGETFCYNQLCTYAVSVAVSRATGRSVHDLVRERILDPLGAGPTWWIPDEEGNSAGFSGLHIAPRDLASFIGLLASSGVHRGERLLPQRWIEEYSRRRVDTASEPDGKSDWQQGYGWQVWMGQEAHRADGAYGQYGLIWPEDELAVVITSAVDDMQVTIDQVRDLLLPRLGQLEAPERVQVPVARGGSPVPGAVWQGEDTRGGRVQLTAVEGGWELLWDDADGGSNRLGVGHGHWVDGTMAWPGRRATVSASGGRADDGSLEVRIACVETPHTAVLTLRGDLAQLTWPTPPLGQDTLAGVALPEGWRG